MKFFFIFLFVLALYAQEEKIKEPKSWFETLNLTDIDDSEAKEYLKKYNSSSFGLKPYRANYLLPLGYTSYHYKTLPYTPTDAPYIHVEAEIQVSFKLLVAQNIFGYNEKYYAAYTQRSFWQIYTQSSPFRESNYNPELFVIFPKGDIDFFGYKALEVGYSHISNGQGNIELSGNAEEFPQLQNRSRSLNVLYAKFLWQYKAILYDLKLWSPLMYEDDNPDIYDYYGYMQFDMKYFYKKNLFTLMVRGNPVKLKGALEATYSYPLHEDIFLYAKIFHGYGESLIDYNHNLTKYSIGFSFSR